MNIKNSKLHSEKSERRCNAAASAEANQGCHLWRR